MQDQNLSAEALQELQQDTQPTFESLFIAVGDWAQQFGAANKHIKKLRGELDELAFEIRVDDDRQATAFEFADCLMCLFAAAYAKDFTPNDILRSIYAKHAVNQGRVWEQQDDGTFKHVK